MKDLGLYIHIPFCESKCYYCDFYSVTNSSMDLKEKYIQALVKELNFNIKNMNGFKFDTVFIGGGTPSIIDVNHYKILFEFMKKNKLIKNNAEITMEVNPKSRGLDYLSKIKEIGVNRLSIGIQTFNDKILKLIGRNHNKKEAEKFLRNSTQAGFKNISCDLIFNLPLQRYHHIEKDISILEKNNVKHISLYSLKVNPDTKMKSIVEKDPYRLMDEDEERAIYYKSRDLLSKKNYMQYEISNFSIKDYESKHNLKYWNRQEYFGIGASAHSFINRRRFSNISNVEKYIERIDKGVSALDFEEFIEKDELAWEYLILGLRKTEGISIRKFENDCNTSIKIYKEKIRDLEKKGLVKFSEDRLKLTKKGMDLSNYVFVKLK